MVSLPMMVSALLVYYSFADLFASSEDEFIQMFAMEVVHIVLEFYWRAKGLCACFLYV